MRKLFAAAFISAAVSMIAATAAFAGSWQHDGCGWWYDNGDGTYAQNEWRWLDADRDGTAECYCFDRNGYLYTDTTTPDGSAVNADGAWTVNGIVQTKAVAVSEAEDVSTVHGVAGSYRLDGWQAVMENGGDGYSVGWMNLDQNGNGSFCLGEWHTAEPVFWAVAEDELSVSTADGARYTGFWYPELNQVRLVVGGYVYYFSKN